MGIFWIFGKKDISKGLSEESLKKVKLLREFFEDKNRDRGSSPEVDKRIAALTVKIDLILEHQGETNYKQARSKFGELEEGIKLLQEVLHEEPGFYPFSSRMSEIWGA